MVTAEIYDCFICNITEIFKQYTTLNFFHKVTKKTKKREREEEEEEHVTGIYNQAN
jgi:hypothetical protein